MDMWRNFIHGSRTGQARQDQSSGRKSALGKIFGEEVWIYLLAEDLDKMASKWPTIYLSRISEASKIIKTPDYAAYLEKENTLYFIKEYLKDGDFQKVALSVKKDKAVAP
jgi:hypothetical protein